MNARLVAVGVVALLIGLLVGYLLWGAKVAELQQAVGTARTEASQATRGLDELKPRLADVETKLRNCEAERKVAEDALHEAKVWK